MGGTFRFVLCALFAAAVMTGSFCAGNAWAGRGRGDGEVNPPRWGSWRVQETQARPKMSKQERQQLREQRRTEKKKSFHLRKQERQQLREEKQEDVRRGETSAPPAELAENASN